MKLINRNYDIISGSHDLEDLYTFKNFPIYMGCTDRPIDDDILVDMSWYISRETGIIQLNPLIPFNILYSKSHGAGSVGDLWNQHHSEFAKFISNYAPKSVLEIGGGHGLLSLIYKQYDTIDWTIVEPDPTPVKDVEANYISSYFDETFELKRDINAIVHSHVLEHIYYPDKFIKAIANNLDEGKNLFFSLPNMQIMLKRKYTNCINFEHTIFLAEPYVKHLLSKYGFRLIKKDFFLEDHSIFYAFVREVNSPVIELPYNLYEKHKKLYLDYISYHLELVATLNRKINKEKSKPIYLFGAHIFTQYLIEFGLNSDKIVCLLDNDTNKQNKRLYGTSLTVSLPQILKDVNNPIVILKAGVYNQEIKTQILSKINSNTIFWE